MIPLQSTAMASYAIKNRVNELDIDMRVKDWGWLHRFDDGFIAPGSLSDCDLLRAEETLRALADDIAAKRAELL